MIRDVDLISHLPPYLQEYRELDQITKAEDPEFQFAFDESERIKDNQFVTTSDLKGIERFESLLKIHPSTLDNLESRISRVLTRWNDTVPYTMNSFINKLETLSGDTDFNIIKRFTEYTIEIETNLGLFGQVNELEHFIKVMLPNNMVVISRNNLYGQAKSKIYMGSGIAFTNFFTITHDFETSYQSDNQTYLGSVLTNTVEQTITGDYETSYEADNESFIGGISSQTVKQVISNDFEEDYESNADIKQSAISVNTSKYVATNDFEKVTSATGEINKGSTSSVVSIIEID